MRSTQGQAQFQSTFKVDIGQNASNGPGASFHPRKSHKKSRGGCQACKKRRVKCDEARPSCTRCSRTATTCSYPEPSTPDADAYASRNGRSVTRSPSPGYEMNSMAVSLLGTQLDDLLNPLSKLNVSGDSISTVRILQHFQAVTSSTIGGPLVQDAMQSFVVKRAMDNPYLLHMALAVSAAHMRRLTSESDQHELHGQYKLAEADHGTSGLQLWQKNVGSKDLSVDAAIATVFLTTIFTFALDDMEGGFRGGENEDIMVEIINPLAALGGFRAVTHRLRDFNLNDTAWAPVLMASDDSQHNFTKETPGIVGLPRALVDLCDLNENSTPENNPYHRIVRLLTPLLQLDGTGDDFGKLMAFCGRVWPNLKPLVFKMDPIALLLLSYWIALLRRLDQWWLVKRTELGCTFIVSYLSKLPHPKIHALLAFPASFGQSTLSYIW